MTEENVAIRLKHFMGWKRITNSQFADRCGIPRPSLSQLLNGRNQKISDIMVGQIHRAFPELNVLWLLFGEGEMLSSSHSSAFQPEITDENAGENPNFPPSGGQSEFRSKESGLKLASEDGKSAVNEMIRPFIETRNETNKIENSATVQRRISHITVYYDDFTFETFVPK